MLKIKNMNLNNVIRQGDSQPREYQLDTGNLNLNFANKQATIRLMTGDYRGIAYETTATVSSENRISFSIDDVIPAREYRLEITVDDYVFPSRATDGRFDIDPSSHGQEVNIIQIIGKDEIVRDVKVRVENELEPFLGEVEQAELDRQAQEEARETAEGERSEWFETAKPKVEESITKAEQSTTKSAEALTKSQNALNVANGIDAKATNALDLSESADTLSKSVQSQFNQVVIDGDSSVEAAQARVDASGHTNATLKERLDKEHTEVTTQLAQTTDRLDGITINPMHPPIPIAPAVSDANYYDAENFKYYQDEAMTIPATDNKPAFQAMVNYLKEKGGGTIVVPNGNYVFRSAINWESKVSLIGANKISTKLFAEGNLFSLLQGLKGATNGSDADDPDVWFEGCTFKDFLIDNKGLSYPTYNVGGKALFILYMKKAVFQDLILMNTVGTALGCDFLVDTVIDRIFTYNAGRNAGLGGVNGNSGIGIGTCSLAEEPIVVSNCFLYNSGNYGVFVETQHNPAGHQSRHAKVVNCHAMGNRNGFGNKGSGGVQWLGNTAYRNEMHGFHLTQESSGDQIINCISDENGGDGIRIENTYMGDLDISNVRTNKNDGAGINQQNNIRGGLENLRIAHVTAHENGGYGVGVEGNTKNLKIIGVDAVNNGQNAPTSAHRRGILLQGTHEKVSVLNNMVYDDQEEQTQLVGIDISSGTTDFLLDGNNVTTYSDANAYQIRSTAGTIGTNVGLLKEMYGVATIPDGSSVTEVVHGFGSVPKVVSVTLFQYSGADYKPVWVHRSDGNMIRVRREGTTGDLEFHWIAKKYDPQ